MAKAYRISTTNVRGPVVSQYPADAKSLAIVQQAGGRSKLTSDQADQVKWKQVGPGDDCSDMPAASLATFLERGWAEEVGDEPREDAWADLGRPKEDEVPS